MKAEKIWARLSLAAHRRIDWPNRHRTAGVRVGRRLDITAIDGDRLGGAIHAGGNTAPIDAGGNAVRAAPGNSGLAWMQKHAPVDQPPPTGRGAPLVSGRIWPPLTA